MQGEGGRSSVVMAIGQANSAPTSSGCALEAELPAHGNYCGHGAHDASRVYLYGTHQTHPEGPSSLLTDIADNEDPVLVLEERTELRIIQPLGIEDSNH